MSTLETLERLQKEALSGGLGKVSAETLEEYAAALCHSQAFNVFGASEFPQICETVRIHLLRAHIGNLQGHITSLDAKNTKLSWLVVVLTVASLIGTGIQSTVAIRAEARAVSQVPPTASAPQTPTVPQASPTQTAPQEPGQPTKKTP